MSRAPSTSSSEGTYGWVPMRVAGADVWKGRWIVVILEDGRFHRAFVAATFGGVLGAVPGIAVLGVDIPIGLPEPGRRRAADELARKYVGPRWHSVFITPPSDLLRAESLKKANELAKGEGREGIAAQVYALGGAIREVQAEASRDPRIYEVHPEVSFVRANAVEPLPWSKASWNGLRHRQRILHDVGVEIPDEIPGVGQAGAPDVLDAAIVAWSASRIASGAGERLPKGRRRADAIWY